MKRTLSLKKETLAELDATDLAAVNGAAVGGVVPTLPISDCCPSRVTEATCTW